MKPTKKTAKTAKSPLSVGNSVLIRGVGYHYLGRVVGLSRDEILLEDASWLASSGRFGEALRTGRLSEVEPYPDGPVAVRTAVVQDVALWAHLLPRKAL
jgi:hypothetical protein